MFTLDTARHANINQYQHNIKQQLTIKKFTTMTQQAKNSIALYRGNNPAKIEMLLNFQRASVVNELKEHFGASNIHDLAIKLSFA